jgi:O-antigen/teichoic acid export membrane protein
MVGDFVWNALKGVGPAIDMQLQNNNASASLAPSIWEGNVGINLLAGCLSKAWSVIVILICTPYFVRTLGADGYGLVAVFLTLQRVCALLDSGLSTTINKEMACHSSRHETQRLVDMVRTLEVVYWALSLLVFVIVLAASDWIASEWIRCDKFSKRELQSLILVMGLAIAVQLPQSFYSAALAGQERHVTLNMIRIVWHGVRFLGAIPVLAFIGSSLFIFFQWQVITGVFITAATAAAIWWSLPRQPQIPRFRLTLFREVLGFTLGAGMFTITAVVINQIDKVILSKQLTSDEFGYYMLAFSFPSALFLICTPIQTVIFPRLAHHHGRNDNAGVKASYHLGSQLMALAIVPIAITGAFFSREIMEVWLNDSEITDKCYRVTSLLFCGMGLNCLSAMPHTLQLSHGWTRLANILNLASIVVLGPLFVWSCSHYGAMGASFIWLIYGASFLLLQVHFMHSRLLPAEKARWAVSQIVAIGVCVLVGSAARQLLHPANRISMLASVVITWLICFFLVLAISPLLRRSAMALWKTWIHQISGRNAKNSTF